jgi:large subunit ribosomal protein L24
MANLKIQKGDKVLIIAGRDRNKTGLVERVLPQESRVIVTGVNVVKKHLKRTQSNPQGGVVDKTLPIHISNVMVLDQKSGKPTRLGIKLSGQDKIRYAKRSGEAIKKESK